jgi:hypothetical protein
LKSLPECDIYRIKVSCEHHSQQRFDTMKKTLAALALGTMALSAPAFAQTQDLPPTLEGTGLTPEVAGGLVAATIFLGVIISDDDDDPTTSSTTTTTTTN